jgi:hypothetical protein
MVAKLTVILYFISFLFGPIRTREQKCHIVGQSKDKILQVLKKDYGNSQYSDYVIPMLQDFSQVPYGGGAAGCGVSQTLINVERMDCMTLVENVWALACTRHMAAHMNTPPDDDALFALYVQNLNAIRYYEGKNERNEDRIQYLSSAFIQLENAGVLENPIKGKAEPLKKKIHYVSSNKAKFGGFKDWAFLASKEAEMSQYTYYHYRTSEIDKYLKDAQNGDFIGLLTTVNGLDVSHCGILSHDGKAIKMTHASSVKKQVVIEQDLKSYLAARTTIHGIIVYRPRFPNPDVFTRVDLR